MATLLPKQFDKKPFIDALSSINSGFQAKQKQTNRLEAEYSSLIAKTQADLQLNTRIADYNLNMFKEDISRQTSNFLGSQKARSAGSGFAVGSKSFLEQYSDTLAAEESSILNREFVTNLQKERLQIEANDKIRSLKVGIDIAKEDRDQFQQNLFSKTRDIAIMMQQASNSFRDAKRLERKTLAEQKKATKIKPRRR